MGHEYIWGRVFQEQEKQVFLGGPEAGVSEREGEWCVLSPGQEQGQACIKPFIHLFIHLLNHSFNKYLCSLTMCQDLLF